MWLHQYWTANDTIHVQHDFGLVTGPKIALDFNLGTSAARVCMGDGQKFPSRARANIYKKYVYVRTDDAVRDRGAPPP